MITHTVAVGAGSLLTGMGAVVSMRAAYRMASPAGQRAADGCRCCGAAFRPGLAGWFTLIRHCRACRHPHGPPRSIIVVTGACASAVLTYRLAPFDAAGWVLLWGWHSLLLAGMVLSVVDLAVRRLPTRIIAIVTAAVVLAVVAAALLRTDARLLVGAGGGAAALGCGYLLLFLAFRGGIGAGDVRLAVVIGWLTGAQSCTNVLVAAIVPYLLVGPVALGSLVRARVTGGMPAPVAFGPFLLAGALVAAVLH